MSIKIYEGTCGVCKKEYRGQGKRFCSHACRNLNNRNFVGFPGNQFAKGHHWRLSEETRKRQSLGQLGNTKMLGRTQSLATRLKISAAHRARVAAGIHHSWKGGITKEHVRQRLTIEYKLWREAVFKRDNYTCQSCLARNKAGTGNDIYLEAHHIQRFADFPEFRFDVSNGITLCRQCHKDLTFPN